MFNIDRIIEHPLIQTRSSFNGVPNNFHHMGSSQFWYYLESDCFEKIVAIRTYAYQNYIVFKIRFFYTDKYISILLKEPELRILKCLWDCEHKGINFALKEYLTYSSSCFQQWVKRTEQNEDCFDWYIDLNMGKKNG